MKKLIRVFRYIHKTRWLPLTLEADREVHSIKWWVDNSYGGHPDMKIKTGDAISLGNGSAYSTSRRQKISSRSSIESKLVNVNDVMTLIVCTRYFLDAHVYDVTKNIVHKDSKNKILLQKNSKISIGKRTNHTSIRYFFVIDNIEANELTMKYRPTCDMTGDFFMTPNQGVLFIKFR